MEMNWVGFGLGPGPNIKRPLLETRRRTCHEKLDLAECYPDELKYSWRRSIEHKCSWMHGAVDQLSRNMSSQRNLLMETGNPSV